MHRGKIWLSTLIFYVRYGQSTGSTCIFLKRACAAPLILASKSFFSSVLCWTTDSSILLERFCLFMSVSLDACLFNYASLHSICKASWPQKKKIICMRDTSSCNHWCKQASWHLCSIIWYCDLKCALLNYRALQISHFQCIKTTFRYVIL